MDSLIRVNFKNKGYFLVELLIALSLMVVVFGVIINLFLFTTRAWYNDNKMLELQQEAKFSVDSIVRDIAYAKSFQIYPDKFEILLEQENRRDTKIVYYVSTQLNQSRLMRDNQPVTGQTMHGKFSVENLSFHKINDRTILIKMNFIDVETKQKFMIDTAASMLNEN
ncbi:PilW family protein [Anaerosinus massiliensis]|uniref:PilW family protein n=1 Tax=Massilibacillus massiliensis TaxID=1806837 RepID=UPI000DA5F853|nr:hypothetical protein [Massilibacillus massiliensis]